MQLASFFIAVSWIVLVAIVWYKTDVVNQYTTLFGIGNNIRIKYLSFLRKNPYAYLPDFLLSIGKESPIAILRFLAKLQSCALCLIFWLATIAAIIQGSNLLYIGPIYVCAVFCFYLIKWLIQQTS